VSKHGYWGLLNLLKRARKQTAPLARQNYAPKIPLPELLAAGFFLAATFFLAAGFFLAATFFLAAGFFLAATFFLAAGFFVLDVAILILHKI
jgi:hypothetical protein